MERITSAKNPLIQHIRRLLSSRAYRVACGQFAAEGWKLLDEALRWYPRFAAVVATEGMSLPVLPGIVITDKGLVDGLSQSFVPVYDI